MKKFCFLLLLPFLVLADEERPLSAWLLPDAWHRHSLLRQELINAIRRGDTATMEQVCRAGIATMPGDATWHYNLACALAYRGTPESALDELEKAIRFGFRQVDAINADKDLARVKSHPRFNQLVDLARSLKDQPVEGRPALGPQVATLGGTVTLASTNFVFNFDTGLFDVPLELKPSRTALPMLAQNYSKSKGTSPEVPYVAAWLSEGSAAGNAGDLYINRDRAHSWLATGDFPLLTVVRYPQESQATLADVNHPNARFANPVFGNISRGYISGPYWRSMARHSFTAPSLAIRMDTLYRSNQFWVMPCVNDFGKPEIGDVFPANAPFQCVSLGASWSDQPFLRAALAASASFVRVTKEAACRRKLLGPTLQWLLRSTLKGVENEADYLSAKAHPTAFPAKRLDLLRLVKKAHELRPEQIPPAVSLDLINSTILPIRYPQPVRDYPDLVSELLFATPSAIAIVLRAPAGERTFMFRARSFPEPDPTAKYIWKVVNGDPGRVKITAPVGDLLATPETGCAQITIDRRGLTNRIDVACFAKSSGTGYGAPSIISFSPVSLENRVYRPDGRLDSIDYTNPDLTYCDPNLALPRNWKDTFHYDANGTCTGFTRTGKVGIANEFTANGERIVERRPDGTPKTLQRIRYVPRNTGASMSPVELTYTDDGAPFEAK